MRNQKSSISEPNQLIPLHLPDNVVHSECISISDPASKLETMICGMCYLALNNPRPTFPHLFTQTNYPDRK